MKIKIGSPYVITLKNGDELYGYTVQDKREYDDGTVGYVLGYEVEGKSDFLRVINEDQIRMCVEVN